MGVGVKKRGQDLMIDSACSWTGRQGKVSISVSGVRRGRGDIELN